MPAELQPTDRRPIPRVFVSGVLDLNFALFAVHRLCDTPQKKHDPGWLRDLPENCPQVVEHIASFWDDGYPEWSEFLLYAWKAGALFDEDPARLLAELPELAARQIDVPALPSEPANIPDLLARRLARLRESPELRAEYVSLVRELWGIMRPYWDTEGRERAEGAARILRKRLAEQNEIRPLLPKHHFALRDQHADIVERALARGEAVLVPLGLAGAGVEYFVLPGTAIIGFGPDAEEHEGVRREESEQAAARFKLLSDPTRLAILRTLNSCPFTIGDLSRMFEVSQPTVSVHVKALREAGLVTSQRIGGRTLYQGSKDDTREFIAEAMETI